MSLEFDEQAQYAQAAVVAGDVIEQILAQKGPEPQLYNLNIPTAALPVPRGVRIVPMSIVQYGERYIERQDPKGRSYYWAATEPGPRATDTESDLSALEGGFVSLSPLKYDMTDRAALRQMEHWTFQWKSPQ